MGDAITAQRIFELVAVIQRGAPLHVLDFMRKRLEWAEGSQVLTGTPICRRSGTDNVVDTENFVNELL
ncbi:hypothetical protein D3C79_928700 [compost metagenome]